MNRSIAWRLGALVLLALLVVGLYEAVDLRRLLEPQRMAAWLRDSGALGPLLLIGLLALAVVLSPIPSLPLDIAAGIAFGPWLGTLYAATGALLGSIVSFGIARFLGREFIERFLSGHIDFCRECSDKLLGKVVFVSRLIPAVSFDVVSYGAGLTKISLRSFSLATFFGMLPLTFLYVSSGAVLGIDWRFALVLGACMVALFFLLPRWIERRNLFGLRGVFRHADPDDGSSASPS